MIEVISNIDWSAVGQIIMIDILLGGDNAIVIALACRNLPPELRTKGIAFGTLGAIVLRIILIAFAVTLLSIPWLRLVGGLLLIWIGIKLVMPEDDAQHDVGDGGTSLMSAIKTVVLADLIMSVDNVIGISAAAQQAPATHQMPLIIFGLLVSIPIIVWGSRFVISLLDRFPIIVWLGGALLGWIAGGLIITDVALTQTFGLNIDAEAGSTKTIASAVGAIFVIATAWLLSPRRSANR